MEWFEVHTREAFWGAVTVVVVAGGIWFYQKSQSAQARNAAVALDEAEQALGSGNVPLAQNGLEKLVKRWPDTPSGKVGLVLLVQVHYQKGEYQRGVDALKPLTTGNDPYFTSNALSLAAGGLEQLHKYVEAAAAFKEAAARSQYDSDRGVNLSSAARTLLLAGKVEEAKAIYLKLASDPSGVAAAEARVRLGEMDSKPTT